MPIDYSLWFSKIIVANNLNNSPVCIHMYLERVAKQMQWKVHHLQIQVKNTRALFPVFCKSENISK